MKQPATTRIKLIAIAAAFMIAAAAGAPAAADDNTPSWTGLWVGGNVGYAVQTQSAVDDQGSLEEGTAFDVSSAADGVTFGGGIGFDQQFGSLVAGILADIHWTNAKHQFEIPTKKAGLVGDIGYDYGWFVGGRLGFLATPKVLLYGLGGYTKVSEGSVFDRLSGAEGEDGVNVETGDLGGLTVGAGIEALTSSGWSAKLEYRFTDLGDDTIKWAPHDEAVADIDNNLHQVGVWLTYRFGANK